jgi:hypothetical protein
MDRFLKPRIEEMDLKSIAQELRVMSALIANSQTRWEREHLEKQLASLARKVETEARKLPGSSEAAPLLGELVPIERRLRAVRDLSPS